MRDFTFLSNTKIIFGRNADSGLSNEIRSLHASRALLHYGSGSIKNNGIYDRVISQLKEAKIEFTELAGVVPNARLGLVREGINICRNKNIDFILAVGGGSVIDSAKAIAAGIHYSGDVWDLFESKASVAKVVDVGSVLTISAAGSETSKYSVITNEEQNYKKGLGSDLIRPRFVIMNPEFTISVPKYHKFCGVIDIMAHVMERYFGKQDYIGITDLYCEAALLNIINHSLAILKDPQNYESHAELMWTGTLVQNDLLSAGTISDFEVHKIEHELSARYDISHGGGLAIVLPKWMLRVYKKNPVKFARIAQKVWGITSGTKTVEDVALEGIRSFESYIESLGLPISLSALNIGNEQFEDIAKRCTSGGPIGRFFPLESNDIVKILQSCL